MSMPWLDRFLWLVFLIPPPLVPALAWAQPAEGRTDEIVVVEDGPPAPVPPSEVVERLRAELPGASIRVAAAGDAPAAGTVTVALTPAGTLQIVYRDAAGREATRILADTHDPSAVAAAVAMIVANLHRSQLDSVLGPPVTPPPPAAAPPVVAAQPPPVNAPVPDPVPPPAQPTPHAVVRLVRAAAPAWQPGWVLDAGGLYAVVAASAVVGVGYELSSATRVGIRGNLAYLPEDESTAFTLDAVVTHLGQRRPGRFDFGTQGGLLAVDDGELLGAHIGPFASYLYAFGPSVSVGARVGIDVALIDGTATVWPTAAIFCELPL